MKRFLMIFAIVMVIFSISGCASLSTSGGAFYVSDNASMARRGEATNTVWFGIFGTETFPSAERVARENNITRIATVERYVKLGVLGIWAEYTTIVTGQ